MAAPASARSGTDAVVIRARWWWRMLRAQRMVLAAELAASDDPPDSWRWKRYDRALWHRDQVRLGRP